MIIIIIQSYLFRPLITVGFEYVETLFSVKVKLITFSKLIKYSNRRYFSISQYSKAEHFQSQRFYAMVSSVDRL